MTKMNELNLDQQEEEKIELASDLKFLEMPAKFGNVPTPKLPLGAQEYGSNYSKIFPYIRLPIQEVETYSFGHNNLPYNQLFWGDNLHIMRQLPKESIDLIYIDPPFFSGRDYNVIFGDNNEVRSFSDIWEGGIEGYLLWFNARLVQMKRLLKSTGSIYVHLDWHASHYVKSEMDKIFGYENFRREIIWSTEETSGFKSQAKNWIRSHDSILFYTRGKDFTFNKQYLTHKEEYTRRFKKSDSNGRKYRDDRPGGRKQYLDETQGKILGDVWSDIMSFQQASTSSEIIGYPTQKPEALLDRIIRASSNPGDIIADFFCGGGTTLAVAQKMGRRWIGSDQSRVAIAVTKDRLIGVSNDEVDGVQNTLGEQSGFKAYHWGNYLIPELEKLNPISFRKFIVECFNGDFNKTSEFIHGYRKGDKLPIFVGSKNSDVLISKREVISFAKAILENTHKKEGFILGWGFDNEAKNIAHELKKREGIRLDFVKLDLIKIGTKEFKDWIVRRNSDYDNFLEFIMPPLIKVNYRELGSGDFEFDASESLSMNSGEKLVNVQWDFNYDGKKFRSTRGYSYTRDKGEPVMKVLYKFQRNPSGRQIACRIQDSCGGENFEVINIK